MQNSARDDSPDPQVMEKNLRKRLAQHFWLRGHMVVILVGVLASGFLADQAFLRVGLLSLWARYAASISFSYFVFFVLVRLWCWLLFRRHGQSQGGSSFSGNLIPNFSGGGGGGPPLSGGGFSGGGGSFSGGGASETWAAAANTDVTQATVVGNALTPDAVGTDGSDSGGGFMSSIGDAVGSAGSGDSDGIVIVVFVLLVALVCGVGVYLVWDAPALLSGAAFHAVFAGGLAHRTRQVPVRNWIGHLFGQTWLACFLVLAGACIFGVVAQSRCQASVHTLHEAIYQCKPLPANTGN